MFSSAPLLPRSQSKTSAARVKRSRLSKQRRQQQQLAIHLLSRARVVVPVEATNHANHLSAFCSNLQLHFLPNYNVLPLFMGAKYILTKSKVKANNNNKNDWRHSDGNITTSTSASAATTTTTTTTLELAN